MNSNVLENISFNSSIDKMTMMPLNMCLSNLISKPTLFYNTQNNTEMTNEIPSSTRKPISLNKYNKWQQNINNTNIIKN